MLEKDEDDEDELEVENSNNSNDFDNVINDLNDSKKSEEINSDNNQDEELLDNSEEKIEKTDEKVEKKDLNNVVDNLNFDLDKDDATVDELMEILKTRHIDIYNPAEGTNNLGYYRDLFASRTKDKAILAKIRDAVNTFNKQRGIIKSVVNPILNDARSKGQTGNLDIRDIENISLIYSCDGKYKTEDEAALRESCSTITTDFLKYPNVFKKAQNTLNITQDYLDMQTETVSPYLDMLNDFMMNTSNQIIKKYDYNLDFEKLSKEEIVSLTAYTVLTQTFIKKNTQEFRDYFGKKFDSYDKQVKFFEAVNRVNAINYQIVEQLDKYGHITKIDGINNHIIGDYSDVREFTSTGLKNYIKFEHDKSKIDIDLPKNYNNVFNTEENNTLSQGLTKLFTPFLDASERGSKIGSPSYELIFIDGEPLQNLAYPKDPITGDRYIDNNKFDYQTKMSHALKRAIDSQDKVIEFAYITDYKTLANVELKPVYFHNGNKAKENAYQRLVESKKVDLPRRTLNAEEYTKKLCEKYADLNVRPYIDTVMVTKNQMISSNYINELVDNSLTVNNQNLEDSNNIINDLDGNLNINEELDKTDKNAKNLNELINHINEDFHNSLQIKKYNDVNNDFISSPIYRNNEVLKSVFTNIYKIEDYANILANYISNVPGAKFNKAIDRDLSAYFISLKGKTLTERVEKSLQYVKAIKERDNGNFEPIREIQSELIYDLLSSRANTNFTRKSNIYNMYVDSHSSIVIQELLSKDPVFTKNFKRINPDKYYALQDKLSCIEVIDTANRQDIFAGCQFTSKYASQPKEINAFNKFGVNLEKTIINVDRNILALGNAIYESRFSNKNSIELNFDMSMYGVLGPHQKLPNRGLASEDIESLCNTINEKSEIFAGPIDYDTALDPKAVALASTEVMLQNYAIQACSNEFIKDILQKDQMGPDDVYEYLFKTIYVNDKSIFELTNNLDQDLIDQHGFERVGAAIFTKALHDKNAVISMASMQYNQMGELETHVVTCKKNYNELVKQTENNHGFLSRIGHMLGIHKYNVETMRDDYQNTINNFEQNNVRNSIKLDFEEKFKENISQFKSKETIKALNEAKHKAKVEELKKMNEKHEEREFTSNLKLDDLDEKINMSKYIDDTKISLRLKENIFEEKVINKDQINDLEPKDLEKEKSERLNK